MREFAKRVVVKLLRAYQWAISPLFPPACRYVPTCSEYGLEAVERYGALRGILMTAVRLCRCHPFARGGYDPVVKRSALSACGGQITEVRCQEFDRFREEPKSAPVT